MSDSSVTPGTVAHQTPLSLGFSRQEYWSGLPFPSPVDLPDPGIEPTSPALADRCLFVCLFLFVLPLSHQGSPVLFSNFQIYETLLLTTATVLYITSSELIYLIIGSLYLLSLSPISPTSHLHGSIYMRNLL